MVASRGSKLGVQVESSKLGFALHTKANSEMEGKCYDFFHIQHIITHPLTISFIYN
jgi:hypothetical protein